MFDKISAKIYFACPQEEKATFASSHCLIAISTVGQPKSDGDKLTAILKKVNERFAQCTILLGDSLHRHTYKIYEGNSVSDEVIYKKSLEIGDQWIERNIKAIDSLTIPHKIHRWNEWLKHPNFPAMKNLIDEFYEKNPHYRLAIFESVQEYILRLDRNVGNVNCPHAFKHSAEYLKEECTVMQLMASEGFNFVLYPGRSPKAMQLTYEYFIRPYYPNSMKWIEYKVEVRHKPEEKPQALLELP